MRFRPISRRSLLWSAGAATLAGPFTRVLDGRAAPGRAPRRLVIVCTPNGTVMGGYERFGVQNQFFPDAACNFPRILKPLEPLRAKLVVLRGIDMKSAMKSPVPRDHWPDVANNITARQVVGYKLGGISIDQEIANALAKAPDRPKYASLQLGVQTAGYAANMVARGLGQPIFPENNPYNAFKRTFEGVTVGAGADAQSAQVFERLRADRRSVIDLVGQELGELRCLIGREDRERIEAHLASIRELEKSLERVSSSAAGCSLPAQGDPVDPRANGSFPQVGKLQMDLIAATLACDLTRVITLQFSGGASDTRHTWIAGVPNISHHGISHDTPAGFSVKDQIEVIAKIDTWYAGQVAYLCNKLNEASDGFGGKLLDDAAVLWTHEQSHGGMHARSDMPYVLAGSCGGYFKTGQCLDFGGRVEGGKSGVAHNNLLLSLAHAMEVPLTTFGEPEYSKGPLAELKA